MTTSALPLDVFTIVLNGDPFIKYHINAFEKLPFDWHWHIVEGVADLKHDTAWSLENGAKITDALHTNGRSNDGTSAYLDELKKLFPNNITIYRKPLDVFWDGKLEMVKAAISTIRHDTLLWQIDSDELWTAEQIIKTRDMFIADPSLTSAFFQCRYYVSPEHIITSLNTYGNHTDYEWIRVWNFKPGDQWESHEPPRLCRTINGRHVDLTTINPLKHDVTVAAGLVFEHFAYVTEEQLRFKESYYGYVNAVKKWKKIGNVRRQSFLREYLPWVKDDTTFDTVDHCGVSPLAVQSGDEWIFDLRSAPEKMTPMKRILFLRTDSFGDHVLASGMLVAIAALYKDAEITVVCQEEVAALYAACPHIKGTVTVPNMLEWHSQEEKERFVKKIKGMKFDVMINGVYSVHSIADIPELNFIPRRISFRNTETASYTDIVPAVTGKMREIDRNIEFLKGLGIAPSSYALKVWLSETRSKTFTEIRTKLKKLNRRTIAFFGSAQYANKNYPKFADALKNSLLSSDVLIALGSAKDFSINEEILAQTGLNYINLCGATTMLESAEVISECNYAIGVDTSLAHICCAFNIPNTIIVGGGHFERFLPYSKFTSTVILPLECFDCDWWCKFNEPYCTTRIDHATVARAIVEMLGAEERILPRVYYATAEAPLNEPSQPRMKFPTLKHDYELSPGESGAGGTALIGKAELFMEQGNWTEARTVLKDILSMDDRHLDALNDLSVVEINAGNFTEAVAIISKLLSVDPENEIARENLQYLQGLLHDSIGEPSAAQADPFMQGEREIQQGNLAAARDIFTLLLMHDPYNAKVLNNLAVIHIIENNIEAAASLLNQAAAADPADSAVRENLHVVDSIGSGAAVTDGVDERVFSERFAYAEQCIEAERYAEAKAALDFCLTHDPHNIDVVNDLVVVSMMMREYQRAADHLSHVLRLDPANEVARENILVLRRILEERQEAGRSTSGVQAPPVGGNDGGGVNKAFLAKEKEFWNVDTLHEAMFGRVFTCDEVNVMPLEEQMQRWEASAVASANQIITSLPHEPHWKILEIGCGVGRIIKPLRGQFAEVDGVDISEKMVEFAGQYLAAGPHNGRVMLNDGFSLHPLADGQYDLVFSTIVFQHIRSASVVKSYLDEILRVLKPGGYFRLQVHDKTNPNLGGFDEEAKPDTQYAFYGNGYHPDELRGLLEHQGYCSIEITNPSPWIWATAQKPVDAPSGERAAAASVEGSVVSAIVSVYNSEKFMEGCLDDLLQQTLYQEGRLEIVVVNSGSHQNEDAIIRKYASHHAHITYIHTAERETVYQAWNRCIMASTGSYITNANTDDRHAPQAFSVLADALDRNPAVGIVYADCYVTKNETDTWNSCTPKGRFAWPDPDPRQLFDVCFLGPQPMWRKQLHDTYGYFDDSFISAGDYEFWLKLAVHNERMLHLPDVLGIYLENEASISLSDGGLSWNESERARDLHWPASWGPRPATAWRSFEVPCDQPAPRPAGIKKILLACDYFWPSVGGVEVYIEDLGRQLLAQGYEVEVACRALAERTSLQHEGMTIRAFAVRRDRAGKMGAAASEEFRAHILHGGYAAVIALTQPDNWIGAGLVDLPVQRPRIIMLPSISASNMTEWAHNGLGSYVTSVLRSVDTVVTVSEHGYDASFAAQAGVPSFFIPHAIEHDADEMDVFAEFGLDPNGLLLVMVGNFWPVKNHDGLIKVMRAYPGQWQLAIVGNRIEEEDAYYEDVLALTRRDSRIRIIGGLPRPKAAAVIRAADVLLVPSKAESAGPLVVLQAMSYGTPWIATPSCNAVKDEAGGIIAPVADFPRAIEFLLSHPDAAKQLSEAGRMHWDQSFRWSSSLPLFISLIEGTPMPGVLTMSEDLRRDVQPVQDEYAASCAALEEQPPYVFSVIIPTHNRCDILKKCLLALERQTFPSGQYEVIVCDDGSTDNTQETVQGMTVPFKLTYLRQENSGPAAARNRAIAVAAGTYLLILNDDALLEPDAMQIHYDLQIKHRGEQLAVLGAFTWLPEYTANIMGYLAATTDIMFDYPNMTSGSFYDYNHFYTCNVSLEKKAVQAIGGFDEHFTGPAAEDLEFGYRLEQAGYHVLYEASCVAWHDHALTVESFCRVHTTRGYGAVTLAVRQPDAFSLDSVTSTVVEQWKREIEQAKLPIEKLVAGLQQLEKKNDLARTRIAAGEWLSHAKLLQQYHRQLGMVSNPLLADVVARNSARRPGVPGPLISVIMPCYNYACYLPEAVGSVVGQTYTNWELIIVNDGSTDDTIDVAEGLIRKYAGRSIRLINQPNSGQPAISRNNGIVVARGELILPLDADDILDPRMLEATYGEMRRIHCDVVYTDQEYFNVETKIVHTLDFDRERLYTQNYFAYCSLYKKAMWTAVGGYKHNCRGYEDWEFWISCAEAGYAFKRLPEVLLRYRVKNESMLTSALQHDEELRAQIVLYHPELYPQSVVDAARRLIGGGRETANVAASVAPVASRPAGRRFTVVAIISAFNEGDVIYHVIGDLIANGVDVYLLDNNSTDNTVEQASPWLGKGLLHIERFPDDCGYPARNKKEYVWRDLLRRKEELAMELQADWFIHADADEFRESPFEYTTLREGFEVADAHGYNAVNFELLNFKPVDNTFVPGDDVRKYLLRYEQGGWFDSNQIKAWKKTGARVDLMSTGGHNAQFPGRKLFPINFILRHYPIRSEEHGRKKVYQERVARFAADERASGWHVQYDDVVARSTSFLAEQAALLPYDGAAVRLAVMSKAMRSMLLAQTDAAPLVQRYEATLRQKPDDIAALKGLSTVALRFGDKQTADSLLSRLEAIAPSDPDATAWRMRATAEKSGTRFDVSIIVPVFNKATLTKNCIESIYSKTGGDIAFEVIIVDNASTDETGLLLEAEAKRRPHLRTITNKRNEGFARANNIGTAAASGEYLVFLNNDTEVLNGWLSALLTRMKSDSTIGIAGSKLLYPDRTIQHGGIEFARVAWRPHPVWPDHRFRGLPENTPAANIACTVPAVTGACLCISRTLFTALHGFDESYGMYFEDTDLCFKMRKAGMSIVYEPASTVIHFESQSTANEREAGTMLAASEQKFFERWEKEIAAIAAAPEMQCAPVGSTPAASRPVTIGIDIRTFYYSDSTSRGIGHYNLFHLDKVIASRPGWRFILYKDAAEIPAVLSTLRARPNVSFRDVSDFRETDIDLVHVCDPMNLSWGFDAPARIFGPATLKTATFYDLTPIRFCFPDWSESVRQTYLRRIEQLIDYDFTLLAISEYTKKDLTASFPIEDGKIVPIMAGLNASPRAKAIEEADVIRTREKFGIDAPFFLHVGAVDSHKNIDTVVKAFVQCNTSRKCRLVIVGKLEFSVKAFAEEVKRVNIPDIIFTDFISREDLELLYHDAVATLFMSKAEGFGFPVLEAMANGCPVITSNATSIPEVAGDAALVFAPDDIAGVAQAMDSLLTHPERRTALREKGFIQAKKFTWEETAHKTLAVWEKMLDDRRREQAAAAEEAPMTVPSGGVTIGIDARTFFFPDSVARGIGQYSRYHLAEIIRLRPQWHFVLYGEEAAPCPALETVMQAPNVSYKKIGNQHAEAIDLLHILDPMNMNAGFDAPLRVFPHSKTTVTFYDLNPIRFYWNTFQDGYKYLYMRRLEQYLNGTCTLLPISEFTKRDVMQVTKLPENRMVTILAGINTSTVPPDAGVLKRFKITKPFFLHVGALDPHKNFHAVIEAFVKCHERTACQLVVVGQKEYYLKAFADEFEKKKVKDVIFTGFIERSELNGLYAKAVSVLFLSKAEGFGFPVLEAMSQGCPVIASNSTSIPEVAGTAALLFAPEDTTGVAGAMEALITDPKQRETLRARGYEQASKFSWKRTAETTIAAWEALLGARPGGGNGMPPAPSNEAVHRTSDILDETTIGSAQPAEAIELIASSLRELLGTTEPFYAHFGGMGDALMLLSTFYDEHPESTVVSVASNPAEMAALWRAFPRLKKIMFIPYPREYRTHVLLRKAMARLANCRGVGTTPVKGDYFDEWNEGMDISASYGVDKHPRWAETFRVGTDHGRNVVIQPVGGISPLNQRRKLITVDELTAIVSRLNDRGVAPVIIGAPGSLHEYAGIAGRYRIADSADIANQMNVIGSADLFIGADSWGKTLAAFLSISSIVFHSVRGAVVEGHTEVGDNIFLRPWKSITVVTTIEECLAAMKQISDGQTSPRIVWEGSQFVHHSLAIINRELCMRLAADGTALSLIPFEADRFTPAPKDPAAVLTQYVRKDIGRADIHVRHHWPPNLTAPVDGRWVVIQPWEFGALPTEWVTVFSSLVDEAWVPSTYVRDVYTASGVPAERVFVVPNGFDPKIFHHAVRPSVVKSKKKFKMLFVGGTIYRKGIDILLDAYTQTFTKKDDVCLVIKDMGGDSFYKGKNCRALIAEIKKQKDAPAIEYIDTMLSEQQLAGLYRACDVLVHPYRGEGFGMPILEAMACGIPAMVPNGGACLDFCTAANSIFIEARKNVFEEKRVDAFVTPINPWMLEPSLDDLKNKLLYAVAHQQELKELGARAHDDVHAAWTWDHAYAVLKERIAVLSRMPIRRHQAQGTADEMLAAAERLLDENEIASAVVILKRMIETDPGNISALNDLAVAAILTKEYDTAEEILSRVVALDPVNESALENLAFVRQELSAPSA